MSWCTIESDPGVFTELVEKLGVNGVQVEELFSLDKEQFNVLAPIYGLIFLFKWKEEKDTRPTMTEYDPQELFFANQVINNACATQALLSILLNLDGVELGEELTAFKEFSALFPPDIKGLAISNSDVIRQVHNSFARPEPFVPDERKAEKDDDVYHFIAYVPVKGTVYELDGLRPGPINLGKCEEGDWLDTAIPAIQERLSRYAANEIHFNLMAVIENKLQLNERKLVQIMKQREEILNEIESRDQVTTTTAEQPNVSANDAEKRIESDTSMEDSKELLESRLTALNIQIADLEEKNQAEKVKREHWRKENIRRKHNYIPFLVNFLRILADKNVLGKLVEEAEKKASK